MNHLQATINSVRTKLLEKMRAELELNNPQFVSLLKSGNPENSFNWRDAEKELDEQTQPWSQLLDALLDLELALDFVARSAEGIKQATDGRDLHFFIQMLSIQMRASLERLEFFLKRMVRGHVITDGQRLISRVSEAKNHEGLRTSRNTSAHGRFIGTDRPIGDTQTETYWEPYAIIPIDEDHLTGWRAAHENNSSYLKKNYATQSRALLELSCEILALVNTQMIEMRE